MRLSLRNQWQKALVENNPDLAIAEFDFDNDKEDSYAVG